MENEQVTENSRKSCPRRIRRGWVLLFLACVVWYFAYPLRMDSLYMAMPIASTVASYHHNLSKEWRALVQNPTILEILEHYGVEASDLQENVGIDQTIYWLTGSQTVVSYVPGISTDNFGIDSGAYLAGATYVGWKAKLMEFLKAIKWVPGLGKLKTTELGTHYLTFYIQDPVWCEMYLSLDVFDGMLFVAFSTNPDDVLNVTARVEHLGPNDAHASVFGEAQPWKVESDAAHRFWISDWNVNDELPALTAELSSFKHENFSASVATQTSMSKLANLKRISDGGASQAIGTDISVDSAPTLFACDSTLVLKDIEGLPDGVDGLCVAYMTSKPYQGRVFGLAYPAFHLMASYSGELNEFQNWTFGLSAKAQAEKMRVVHQPNALYVYPKQLELLGRVKLQEMAYVDLVEGIIHVGSYAQAAMQQRSDFATQEKAGTAGETVADWIQSHPDAIFAAHIDLPVVAEESKHINAIARMGASFSSDIARSSVVSQLNLACEALQRLAPLGRIDAVLRRHANGLAELKIETQRTHQQDGK